MRALEFTGWGVVELVNAPEPTPGPDDVVLEVDAAGVCGSDLHGIHGGFMREPPLIMGHEFTGHVDGHRAAVNPLISCGNCASCHEGDDHLCPHRQIIGIHLPGGFAERVAVPRRSLVDLALDVSAQAAALIEPLAVSMRGWRLAMTANPSRVAVLGAGTIGLGVLQVALPDIDDVIVVDPSVPRLEVAERLGATRVATELSGDYDVIIDAVGTAESHQASVARLASRGLAVWIGNASDVAGFDARELVRGEHRIQGSFAYRAQDFRDAAALAETLDTAWVHTLPLDRAPEAFAARRDHGSDAIKIQFVP